MIFTIVNARICQDLRDVTYALLGISILHESIAPNYSMSICEVHMDATRKMILGDGNLDVLCAVNRQRSWSAGLGDKPSWVPDWSTPAISNPLIRPYESHTSCTGPLIDLPGPFPFLMN
jgi:hypothetical protein